MTRIRISSGAPWEARVGYSRAVRVGPHVHVTGTTALVPGGGRVDADAEAQARQCLANVGRALASAGARVEDVVRTRMFVTDIARDWEAIGRAHAEVFGAVRPATTMVEVRALIEPWMVVEIEADAFVGGPCDERIGPAGLQDGEAIVALLEASGLPVPAPGDPPVCFVVARGQGLLACAGWERHGAVGLLRSCAVAAPARGIGLGAAVARRALAELALSGVTDVYALTTGAEGWLAGLGFEPVARERLPPDLRACPEATIAACRDAVAMRRRLG